MPQLTSSSHYLKTKQNKTWELRIEGEEPHLPARVLGEAKARSASFYLELLCGPQNQQLLGERGEEHSPLERDSLMPSDEASESSRQAWTGSSQRSSRHLEEDYADAYQDLYQPHRQHTSGLPSANGHDPQDRLLAQDSEHDHNDRNWQRNRPWPKDSY